MAVHINTPSSLLSVCAFLCGCHPYSVLFRYVYPLIGASRISQFLFIYTCFAPGIPFASHLALSCILPPNGYSSSLSPSPLCSPNGTAPHVIRIHAYLPPLCSMDLAPEDHGVWAKGVNRFWGDKQTLFDMELQLPRGQIYGLLGKYIRVCIVI